MKPALDAVVARLRAGVYPSVLQFGAALFEAGFAREEAQGLVRRYRGAIGEGERPSAEADVPALLRSFQLGRE